MITPTPSSNAERIARLEVQMATLLQSHEDYRDHIKSVETKLDELITLRNKGAGAFWLATSLAGAGAISIFLNIVSWFGLKIGIVG